MTNHILWLILLCICFLKLIQIELEALPITALLFLRYDLHFVEERHGHVRGTHRPQHAVASVGCALKHLLAHLIQWIVLLFLLLSLVEYFLYLHHVLVCPEVLGVLLDLIIDFLSLEFAIPLHSLRIRQSF